MATEINPTSMASSLATAYTQAAQDLLTTQTKKAQTTSTALSKLQSALSTFNTALQTLSAKKGVSQNSAVLSDASVGTATASSTAQAGNYSLFVEQVATSNQIAFEDLPAVPVSLGGPIAVKLADGSSININLAQSDENNDGTISQSEIARAINQASDNQGKVTAMVMTVGAKTQLVLSSAQTGVGSAISIDASALPASALRTALSSAPQQLAEGKNAIVWFGAQNTGTRIEQASNSFTSIPGVTLTLSKAMTSGASPMTLSVASDSSATAKNVQSFVDAYNTVEKALDDLTSSGDADSGVAAAAFASDSSIRSLHSHLSSLVRQSVGGASLLNYGVSIDRTGQLTLDSDPDGLDALFGSSSVGSSSGLLGSLSTYLDKWTNSASGQIKNRQDSVQKQQKQLSAKQTTLDTQYNNAYSRYLKQYTALQTLQTQMSQNSSIFDSLSTSSSS
jgi:flagellar hook-associated protein 2